MLRPCCLFVEVHRSVGLSHWRRMMVANRESFVSNPELRSNNPLKPLILHNLFNYQPHTKGSVPESLVFRNDQHEEIDQTR